MAEIEFTNLTTGRVTRIRPKAYGMIYCHVLEAIGVKDLTHITEKQHMTAANAEGWAELACIGEQYQGEFFQIKIIDE